MIKDKALETLSKERQIIIKNIDVERDEEKLLFYEEQLAALNGVIEQRKNDLLQIKSLTDEVELK